MYIEINLNEIIVHLVGSIILVCFDGGLAYYENYIYRYVYFKYRFFSESTGLAAPILP